MDRIGIEFISVLGQPPVDFVHAVADLGCRHIGMASAPIVSVPGLYPDWSMAQDVQLRRDVAGALRDRDVSVSLGEGFLIWPDQDISRTGAAAVDAMADLGAPILNAVCIDPDPNRAADQLGAFADMAAARGMQATIEFVPGTPIGDLAAALDMVCQVARANFKLLIDAMHWFRTGSTLADLAALDPALIGYVQLCDVPWVSDQPYGDEARFDRRAPGEGELPLKDMVAALPKDLVLGLEVPMRAKAEAGMGPVERLRPAVEAAQKLVAEIDA